MDGITKSLRALAPGLAVSGTIAAAAVFLSEHYGAPATLFALSAAYLGWL